MIRSKPTAVLLVAAWIVLGSETDAIAIRTRKPTKTPIPTPTQTSVFHFLTPTRTPTPTAPTPTATPWPDLEAVPGNLLCPGDCDGDGAVGIGDLIRVADTMMGNRDVASCADADTSGDGRFDMGELVAAIDNALHGCELPFAFRWAGGYPLSFAGGSTMIVTDPEQLAARMRTAWADFLDGIDFDEHTLAISAHRKSSGFRSGSAVRMDGVAKTTGRLTFFVTYDQPHPSCPESRRRGGAWDSAFAAVLLPKQPDGIGSDTVAEVVFGPCPPGL